MVPGPMHRIAWLLIAALLAVPGAAWAQSAGDEQYEDPFAPEPGQTEGGGSSQDDSGATGGGSSGGGGTVQPAAPEPAAPQPAETAPATTAQAPDSAEQLPRTGADAAVIALAGALLLASGLALRRRASSRADRA
jgi:LPXTG-motif cell wall-anchored protein